MNFAIARILVPVDFSAHSEQAFRYATALASRLGAAVELLHVVEDPIAAGASSSEDDGHDGSHTAAVAYDPRNTPGRMASISA